ncbi:thiol-disulfide oxidoreductase DCC family protein [Oceanobacillus sp. FSL H7-0719]|uniref:thiol-disulfide oxidoreductase DCC family protein n=1 Tax=Oceanobacillus sp. FSL H7-0719 TaxID=2954507 RepID=UPI00324BAFAC
MNSIILFDGECNFCDASVQFIIQRDQKKQFKFASLQGEAGQKLINKYNSPKNIDSLILLENNKVYYKSTAALRIAKQLKGMWKLLYIFLLVPPKIRDALYDIIAKNRYKWFGKKDSCMLPSPEMRSRFLD